MFPWKTVLIISKKSGRAVYLQIVDRLIGEITAGRMKAGMKIPGSRAMAGLLNLNRKTVIQAYDELIAQGWLEVRSSLGTYVTDHLPIPAYRSLTEFTPSATASAIEIKKLNYVDEFHNYPPGALQVNGGSPDPRLAPIDWIYKESRSVIKMRNGYKLLHYSDGRGNDYLRQVLADYLSESRGLHVQAANILITRGSQMGIFLSCSGLLSKGDIVVVGETGYDAADWAIQHHGGQLIRIPVDHHGLNVDKLEAICLKQKVRLVYVTPHHHFPTTVTLSNSRRMKLMELAAKYDFYILEDDYDYDFHYKSAPLLPLASINQDQRVIYIGAFSKVFAPNIRVGYLVAPPDIINELGKIRRMIDRQGDHVMERVIAEAITSGELSRHLKKSIKTYRNRRDCLTSLLHTKLADQVSFKIPEGGMATWITFSDSLPLLKLKSLFEANSLYLDIDNELAELYNSFRFGFASLSENEIEKAVNIMQNAIRQLSS